uniref:Uncharacterized protein n=1 Tax=mine drainage metagenome TaxID=410659 RepID=E6PYQ1_9ZZZZ
MSYSLLTYASGMIRSAVTASKSTQTAPSQFVDFASLLESLALQPEATPACDDLSKPVKKSSRRSPTSALELGSPNTEVRSDIPATDSVTITPSNRKQPKSVGASVQRAKPGSDDDSMPLSYERALRTHARYHAEAPPEAVSTKPALRFENAGLPPTTRSQLSTSTSRASTIIAVGGAAQDALIQPNSSKCKARRIPSINQQHASPTMEPQNPLPISGQSLTLHTETKAPSEETNFSSVSLPSIFDEMLASDRLSVSSSPAAGNSKHQRTARAYRIVDQRCSTISVRLRDAEAERLRRRAEESEMSISAYLRSCVLEADQLRAQVKQALAELRMLSQTSANPAAYAVDQKTHGNLAGPEKKPDSYLAQWLDGCRSLWKDRRRVNK